MTCVTAGAQPFLVFLNLRSVGVLCAPLKVGAGLGGQRDVALADAPQILGFELLEVQEGVERSCHGPDQLVQLDL